MENRRCGRILHDRGAHHGHGVSDSPHLEAQLTIQKQERTDAL